MKHIVAETTGQAWIKAAQEVFDHGCLIKDGEVTLKESLNVFLTVERALEDDPIIRTHADPMMVQWMKDNFLKFEPVLNWGYSYGQRFFNYQGVNQIAAVIAKLKKNPESKSATVTLMDPKGDQTHMPCIVAIDFKIRDGRLMTTSYFRSQDVGKKLYADVICIGEIAKQVADGVGTEVGSVNILISSLHAYEKDWEKVKKLLLDNNNEVLPTDYLER